MTKKHFIALADYIRDHNRYEKDPFTDNQLAAIANFCKNQNGHFMADRWYGYIRGDNGPCGGKVKR